MKLLIIDDESIIRDGLKNIIDWNGYGFQICGEASDGQEAIDKILSLSPDVVLLDIKIPKISGIQVANTVRAQGFLGKFIILSGYSDFEYAKQAIRFGVTAYLLKPLDKTELLEAVLKAKGNLEEENSVSIYTNQNINHFKQNFLFDIIQGKIASSLYDNKSDISKYTADAYQLVLVDFIDEPADNEMLKKFQNTFDASNFEFLLLDDKILMLIKGKKHIISYLKGFKHIDILFKNNPVYIYSSVANKIDETARLYQEIKKMDSRLFFYLADENYIQFNDLIIEKEKSKDSKFDIVNDLENVYNVIITTNITKVTEILNNLEVYFRFSDMSSEKAVRILINFYLQIKKRIDLAYPQISQKLINEIQITKYLCNAITLHQIVKLVKQEFKNMVDLLNEITSDNVIERVKDYIDNNCSNKLKLESVASIFGYNSAYLGKIFKSQTGYYFNNYLDMVRIEKSKKLLMQGYTVNDTAIYCGFNDTNYFSKKFKNFVGSSPANYKHNST